MLQKVYEAKRQHFPWNKFFQGRTSVDKNYWSPVFLGCAVFELTSLFWLPMLYILDEAWERNLSWKNFVWSWKELKTFLGHVFSERLDLLLFIFFYSGDERHISVLIFLVLFSRMGKLDLHWCMSIFSCRKSHLTKKEPRRQQNKRVNS